MENQSRFTADIWIWPAKAAWHFVTLPAEEAERIRFFHGAKRRGWGSLRVKAEAGGESWTTSIFPDSKSGSYLLPVKAEVRKKAGLKAGQRAEFRLTLLEG